ncbi:MAG TPA: copper chaperone PCu(A)C [Burkholderiaceae bacterium]|nr:copper chaperone PCu(A)C [Burkholderiaceae bacterium]
MRVLLLLLCLCAAIVPAIAAGDASAAPSLAVSDAWARATVEGQTGSGVFLHLLSSQGAQLIGASSSAAERVEIHEMRLVNAVMTMRRIERLDLPAGKVVALDHDYHVMLIGLKHQLQVGHNVALTLHWLDAAGAHHSTDVIAPVRALNTSVVPSSGSKRD